MPPIFKALATIMAWGLWIIAWVAGLSTLIMGMITGDLTSTTGPPPSMFYPAMWAVGAFDAILAVVIMILRKKME